MDAQNIAHQCAWCSRWIDLSGNVIELEVKAGTPVSHGICKSCAEAEIDRLNWQKETLTGWMWMR